MIKNTGVFAPRQKKIASLVSKYVAEILLENYLEDSLLSKVVITDADAKGGLQYVKVFFNVRKSESLDDIKKRLEDEKSQIRFVLGRKMNQKYVPEIAFFYDDSLEKAERMNKVFENLNK